MSSRTTPIRLNLKKDQGLDIDWQDGQHSTYSLSYLRTMCPCAQCKLVREKKDPHQLMSAPAEPVTLNKLGGRSLSLSILPGNFAEPLRALSAELVGNYALRIDWSDQHGSGIYSFDYLREISPQK
jgi:DUF971 family protein